MTLKVEGCDDIRFRVADNPEEMDLQTNSEIKEIIDAAHQAYLSASKNIFGKITI